MHFKELEEAGALEAGAQAHERGPGLRALPAARRHLPEPPGSAAPHAGSSASSPRNLPSWALCKPRTFYTFTLPIEGKAGPGGLCKVCFFFFFPASRIFRAFKEQSERPESLGSQHPLLCFRHSLCVP